MSENTQDYQKETMDRVMDRRKIVRTKVFKRNGSQWNEDVGGYGSGMEFEQWQRLNPGVKVISTSVTQKEIPGYVPAPPTPPPTTYEQTMFVSYEEYENNTVQI